MFMFQSQSLLFLFQEIKKQKRKTKEYGKMEGRR